MNILDVKIDAITADDFTNLVDNGLKSTHKLKISKINTEFLRRSLNDANFLKVLNSSDINIVDGGGVLWAARYLTLPISSNKFFRSVQAIWQMIYSGASIVLSPRFIRNPIPEKIPGVEAFKLMIKSALKNQASIFLFGGYESILNDLVLNLKNEFPDLKIAGVLNGYDYQKNKHINVVAEINKTDAKLLVVSLGSPKQELWINSNINKLDNIKIAVGEGGTIDRIAYPNQKAPKFINKIGLEWLWRLAFNKSKTESRNRFGRFWNAVPSFIYQVVKWKIKNGQTKI